ncbi:Putative phosphoribosyl transferasec/MT0597 [Phaeobacter sp. CECT 5382]|uniref:phosphoribosyltransferase n=1 Tax=Phaeobacter sp. CECT 5382 TaxID=1712645 RepID=UPI0006D9F650|nr:phosphoribosyltransferase family protein [Phaeobacter sp. CECT 5382]CUH87413.1 Putative phosphoribosyl transferasec/MT0597 [Phaeobacter sp. CECT 5382]
MSEFLNRTEAGKALGAALALKGYKDPVILALPRGGVPVAIEVVRALRAPIDLVMVRKIGMPGQPELAVAAIVNGDHPQLAINEDVAEHAGLSHDAIWRMAQTRLTEIRRRRELYVQGRGSIPVEGRTAIVVDDGIATGATVRASLKAVRLRKPAKLVLAVPVAASDTLEELSTEVDEIVCLLKPHSLMAVGAHYADFDQTSDEDVVRLLEEADHLTQ